MVTRRVSRKSSSSLGSMVARVTCPVSSLVTPLSRGTLSSLSSLGGGLAGTDRTMTLVYTLQQQVARVRPRPVHNCTLGNSRHQPGDTQLILHITHCQAFRLSATICISIRLHILIPCLLSYLHSVVDVSAYITSDAGMAGGVQDWL